MQMDSPRQYNTLLYRFCPEGAGDDLNQFFAVGYLDSHDVPILLRIASKRAAQLAQKEEDPTIKKRLKLFEDMTKIKGKAGYHNTKRVTEKEMNDLLNYQPEMFLLHRKEKPSTLAVLTDAPGNSSMVYVEFKSYVNDARFKDSNRRDDILKLCRLMRDPESSRRLNTMTCLGFFKDSKQGRIGLSNFLKDNKPPPELGWRFTLAKRLVDSVIRLHTVGWLHKNIRSESILLFPLSLNKTAKVAQKDYYKPILMGYDFIRIEANPTADYSRVLPQGDDGDGRTSVGRTIARGEDNRPDIYHHPDKRKSPGRAYQYAYDIYSLGLLLIEIGLWRPLPRLVKKKENASPEDLQRYILEKVDSELTGACGRIYAEVVKTFITMKSKKSPDQMKIQRNTCAKMASELSRCVA
ncbi:hypothetical protein ABKA04_007995 [Annulohypoxylon sp. FPYF3050]